MVNSGYGGCCYVRMLLPMFHNGYRGSKKSVSSEQDNHEQVLADLKEADVVVFHRPEKLEYHALAKLLKADGKKIVMDNDDTFQMNSHPLACFQPDSTEVELRLRDKLVKSFMKLSDLVTASTDTLADEYKQVHSNVKVLPNCIDPMDWDEPLRNETDKVRIGLVGSVAYEYDYLHIKRLLRKLSKRKDVELVLYGLGDKKHKKENPKVTKAFSDEYKFWESLSIDQVPWCHIKDYPTNLNESKLDIMLIPRKDNYFNRCKSNIKFLEASMCEIPVIAQSFTDGPYEEITHGENGILIKDNHNWESEIDKLISNKELRRTIGKNAKEYVLKNYNIEDKASLWSNAYEELYEKN